MDFDLHTMTVARLALGAVVGIGVAGALAREAWEKHTAFTPVEARILAVSDTCSLAAAKPGSFVHKGGFDCARSDEAMKASRPDFPLRVRHDLQLRLAYVSPVDGRVHVADHLREDWRGGAKAPGHTISILASRTDTDRIEAP